MIRREVEMRWSNKTVNQGYASLTQQYSPSGMDICFYYDHGPYTVNQSAVAFQWWHGDPDPPWIAGSMRSWIDTQSRQFKPQEDTVCPIDANAAGTCKRFQATSINGCNGGWFAKHKEPISTDLYLAKSPATGKFLPNTQHHHEWSTSKTTACDASLDWKEEYHNAVEAELSAAAVEDFVAPLLSACKCRSTDTRKC